MIPSFTIRRFDFFSHPTRTRFPFRYGIASMTDVPHLFVQVQLEVDGALTTGIGAEGLPPKWFTKDPATTFEQDLPVMLQVIRHAADLALQAGAKPITYFHLWQEVEAGQSAWANARQLAPLLAHLGVSLVERAVLDALCRAWRQPLHQALHQNRLGVELNAIYPELGSAEPRELLPPRPSPSVLARHTVGLADPLTGAEIPEADRVEDGLPQDLESCIQAYGLQAFKVKLVGQPERDLARLRALAVIFSQHCPAGFLLTLDGNENFAEFASFRDFWQRLVADAALESLLTKVVAVEQPVHRQHALTPELAVTLRQWTDHPPLIIDESDAAIGDLPRALQLGYSGTSHKNCKGIVKGIANACLLEQHRRAGKPRLLTGEDLCNLGPVALLQDLALVGLLGIAHVERNGHHYFRGLSMWPQSWQDATASAHGDLYRRHEQGFACVNIRSGRLALESVNAAPFGLQPALDPSRFAPTILPGYTA